MVVSRRRWLLGRASFEALGQAGGDRELLVAMARLREVHELPVAFFASTAGSAGPCTWTRARPRCSKGWPGWPPPASGSR
ncbi:hypothetical protein [Nonomuraea rubra]|uniref:hypothetical protein n=1 Tax=Nonomuraea rubra TaxID=46180 RepID=UPI0031F0C6A5